ncbi:hypothetical protein CORC01_01998, partial [Colletotrichum orchidophilum]
RVLCGNTTPRHSAAHVPVSHILHRGPSILKAWSRSAANRPSTNHLPCISPRREQTRISRLQRLLHSCTAFTTYRYLLNPWNEAVELRSVSPPPNHPRTHHLACCLAPVDWWTCKQLRSRIRRLWHAAGRQGRTPTGHPLVRNPSPTAPCLVLIRSLGPAGVFSQGIWQRDLGPDRGEKK